MGVLDTLDAFLDTATPKSEPCKKCGTDGSSLIIECSCGFSKSHCLPCTIVSRHILKILVNEILAHEKTCASLQKQTTISARASLSDMEDAG